MEALLIFFAIVAIIILSHLWFNLKLEFKVNWSDGSDVSCIKAIKSIDAYKIFLDEHDSDKSLAVIVTHEISGTTYNYDSHLENLNLKGGTLIPVKNFPHVGITDRALIAKESITHFPYEDYGAVSDILEGKGEKGKAIEELNLRIKDKYEYYLLKLIGDEFSHDDFTNERDEEIEKIMHLGIRGILKEHATEGTSESVEDVSREIKSSESWTEIKRRL